MDILHNNKYQIKICSSFDIQVSNPIGSKKRDPIDTELYEAIESSFLLESEKAFMVWCGIYIPLCYKYTISYILDDILLILHTLMKQSNGTLKNTFSSDDFHVIWNISWHGNSLEIKANWYNTLGFTEELLNRVNTLKINKKDFICAWKSLLKLIIGELEKNGYNENNINNFNILKKTYLDIVSH